ncbi:uncharacterized protein FTJAE_10802 [Fusarium tjaetaba]|uniref:Uncharacterized protein n=1 Tax=Fusarium tjaetaba TaxID=1567544 RepID=A0A8H5QXF6_9HYPO|nr:uncharacterized protein FTJAE_10802 [Fusarium tjaetaba]KAF5622679.1 hypothetical protein FTJAE_10802 [Fusarium tjaetaba]
MTERNQRTLIINSQQLNQRLLQINGSIYQPYTQIVVIDSNYGDCNVVDICKAKINPQTGAYQPFIDGGSSYSRSIIDVGYGTTPYNTLLTVLEKVGQPKFKFPTGVFENEPAKYDEALVDMLQFSHIDEDHCGKESLENYFSLQPVVPQGKKSRPRPLNPTSLECKDHEDWIIGLGDTTDFRYMYWFYYQLLEKEHDEPKDEDWEELAEESPNPTFTLEVPYKNCLYEDDEELKYKYLCVQAHICLQRWGRMGVVNDWQNVMCKKRNGNNASEVPVQWEVITTYKVNAPPGRDPDDLIYVTLPPATLKKAQGINSPRDFARIKEALRELEVAGQNQLWNPVPLLPISFPPIQGSRLDLENGDMWNVEFVGPTEELYDQLRKETAIARFETAETRNGGEFGPHTEASGQLVKGEDIKNRASIITLFTSEFTKPEFKMLFTGDAHDRSCDIQNTVNSFLGNYTDIQEVHVLKVPHHCSEITSDTNFYRAIRARVYLIWSNIFVPSGQQKKHGNPSLTTLRAIAQGFEKDQDDYDPSEIPAFLFFSDPGSLDPVTVKIGGIEVKTKSNVWHLLNTAAERPWVPDPTRPDPDRDVYNYRCFRLRKKASAGNESFGRVVLGHNQGGGLSVQFTVATRDNEPNTEMLNDWVEMMPAP